MISANVATIKGGTMNKALIPKAGRFAQISRENRIPAISLTQSGGADLREQVKKKNNLIKKKKMLKKKKKK